MLYTICFILLIFALLYWIVMSLELALYIHKLKPLPALAIVEARNVHLKNCLPLVSIIVAAKDEAEHIKASLQSLLKQQGIRFELIVVNDRSTDQTGEIINQLQLAHPTLQTLHIKTLPPQWLGKNHALWCGYKQAQGEYLIFTDADVIFQEDAVATAIQTMEQEQIDHLTLAPRFLAKGFWLNAFVHYFFFSFGLFKRPWRANLEHSKQSIGIGAFNAVKRDCYEAIGTHQAIAMRPDDDVMLGQIIKEMGFRQRIYSATAFLAVEWYSSLGQATKGLEKNAFAGFNYRLWLAIGALCGQFITFFLPFVYVLFAAGMMRWISLCIVLLLLFVYILNVRALGGSIGLDLLFIPITVLLFLLIIARALWMTFYRGGIHWRGTFYSLKDLRALKR